MRALPSWRLVGGAGLGILLAAVPAPATTIPVDSTFDDLDQGPNGNCTLREAVVAANTNAAVDDCPAGEPGPGVTDLITVPAGTYTLAIAGSGEDAGLTGDLDLTDRVSIVGAGARVTVIDADGLDRVFDVGNVSAALVDLTLRGGSTGGNGGGVENGGILTIEGCTITLNSSGGPGGGVRNDNQVTILESTLSGNTTSDHGGGMDDHGSSALENVTVSGNTVNGGGAGGGLYNLGGTSMAVSSSTIVGNSSGGGTALHNGGPTTVVNVLLVGNCDAPVDTTLGGNLESPGDTCGLNGGSDQVDVADPGLGPLADNGGPTDTHALVSGSPALDTAEAAPCPDFDQRGVDRPLDGDLDGEADCDVGAFELDPAPPLFADGFESGDTSAWSSTTG